MRPVRSIIIYNGGAAGDFLKSVCIDQLGASADYEINSEGMMESRQHYFKDFVETCYNNGPNSISQLDYSQTSPVENSHFYFESLQSVTDSLFYIDYPDQLQSEILKLYRKKLWP